MSNFSLNQFNGGKPFDWNAEATRKETIPEGRYRLVIAGADIRHSKSTGDSMLSIQFQVREGDYKGSSIFVLYLLGHSKEAVRNSNLKRFGKLCVAVNCPNAQTTGELMHKEFMAQVSEKEDDYGWKNDIKTYEPLEGMAALQQRQASSQVQQTPPPVPAPVQTPQTTQSAVRVTTEYQGQQPVANSDLDF